MAQSVTPPAAIASKATSASEPRSGEVPIPALLVERAIALGRAEVGLALVHTRRIAIRAVSALLGTIVACAFAQLTLVLLVAWPVLVERIPWVNLLAGVLMSAALAAAGGGFAAFTWAHVARERKSGARGTVTKDAVTKDAIAESAGGHEMKEHARAVNLTERASL
jgi:hypothetical protein